MKYSNKTQKLLAELSVDFLKNIYKELDKLDMTYDEKYQRYLTTLELVLFSGFLHSKAPFFELHRFSINTQVLLEKTLKGEPI